MHDHSHTAGDTESAIPVRATVRERRPVAVAFAVAAVPIVAAFVLAVLDAAATDVPAWLIVALTGLGPLLGALSAAWAQARVTPLADPKDNDGDPLVAVAVDPQ